ncbi:MAG: Hsp20/alpha crystallin family protein [Chthoniobacterales bacterium]
MSILTTWNPIREMESARNRMDRLFGRSLVPWTGDEPFTSSEWSPLVDVSEDDKEFTIKADLPEVKKENVHVTIEDGTLRITGERKFEKEEKGRRYHRIERSYGTFERSFVLPEGAKTDKLKAEFKDGTLQVHLPKAPEIQTKAIEVPVS